MKPVTDPALLAELNGGAAPSLKPVTDPALLDQLEVSGGDRAQAAASGVNRGALVNLAGLPVATALNAWDLAKAGAGVGYHELTGKPVPEALSPSNREQAIGSPEWIAKQIEQRGGGGVINPNRPDDPASRYLHAGGQGVAAGMVGPQALPQALAGAATGGASMLASELAGELGAGPTGQTLAGSLLPAATTAAATRAQRVSAEGQRLARQRAVTDATVRAAQDAGYAFPPAQVNPNITNKVLGGLSGKAATEQSMSLANQPLTNRLARQALQLPDDVPLTPDLLAALRRQEGAHYDAVKNFGPIQADTTYARRLGDLRTRYDERLGGGVGGQPMESLRLPAVEDMLRDMTRREFSSNSAVELIKRFRSDADNSYRLGNSEAAHYQRGIANALEELVATRLGQSNQRDLHTNFVNARQRIAQSYDVQDALNPSTGNVDARKLAGALRGDDASPLTGELRTIADAGGYAPLAMREYQQTPPGVSALDWGIAAGVGAGTAALGAGPLAAIPIALPIARMAARKAVGSRLYQRHMARPPTGQPSVLARSLAAADDPAAALTSSALSDDELRRRSYFD